MSYAFPLPIPVLHTPRLVLRAPREQDFAAMLAFSESPRAAFVGGAIGRQWVWRSHLANIGHWALRGYGFYTVETAEGDFAGRVGVIFHDEWPEPELAWHLYEGFEGRGIAEEAARAARDDYHSRISRAPLISMIDQGNTRSEALAQRLGAALERVETEEDGQVNIYRHPAPEDFT